MRESFVVYEQRRDGTWRTNSTWTRSVDANRRSDKLEAIGIKTMVVAYKRDEVIPVDSAYA